MSGTPKILIVDDEENVRAALERHLSAAGFDCDQAADGRAALGLLRENDYDVALIDLRMPRMGGLDLLKAIRDEGVSAVPVILSGHGEVTNVMEAMQLGAFDFIEKPASPEVIQDAVARATAHAAVSRRARDMASVAEEWETVFDASPDMILVLGADWRIFRCNDAVAKRFNTTKENLVGRFCYEALCCHDRPPGFCPCAQAGNEDAIHSAALHHPVWDGDFEITRLPLTDDSGHVWGFVNTGRDVTEQKHAESVRRESEEKFRVISSGALDAVIMMDPEGNVSFWNAAAERVFGYTADEVLGEDLHGILAPAAYSEAYLRGIAGFRKTGEGAAIGQTLELTALRKGGEEFPIEISVSGIGIRGQWHAVGIVRDITERKHAEQELRAAHAEIEMLLSSISSILIAVGPEDRIVRWNATAGQVFGIPADRAVGQPFSNCGIQWDWPRVLEHVSACLAQNKPVRVDDVPFTQPDAKERMLGLTISPLSDDSGEISGFLVLGADITERKVLEAQLVQAQKLESIGQLAAGIAHEINTPTQYVGDNTRFLQDAFHDLLALQAKHEQLLEAAKEGAVDERLVSEVETAAQEADVAYLLDEIPKAIEQSLSGVERISRIVRAMKEFSHPGTEEKTATDLNHAVENTITVARNEWKYVAEVVTEFDPDLPAVPCLPGEFNQVILNILVNAAQAIADVVGETPEGKGTITVRTRREGDCAEITISDTGPGIPEDVRSRLFDPFFTTKGVGKGTGQGLTIARSVIVDKHGGTITFETETGKGTTFIIRIPLDSDRITAI